MKSPLRREGFTIVELLIVIVVIGILAAITIVAYNGIQQRGRDAQRESDISTIVKALEMYFAENGSFPSSVCSLGAGCKINSGWVTTSDGTWSVLESQLVPKYLSSLPKDPQFSTSTSPAIQGGYNYDFLNYSSASLCNASPSKPFFLLAYRLESGAQKRKIIGDCPGTQPTDYASSEYILVK